MLSYLQEFAKTVKRETPGFKSISVISADSGDVIVSETAESNINLDLIAPFHLEIYKQAERSISSFDMKEGKIVDEILISTYDEYYVINISPDGKFVGVVIVDATKSNLALTRALLDKHKNTVGNQLDSDF